MRELFLATLAVYLAVVNLATAAVVSFNFSGVITTKNDPQTFLGSGFAPGTPYHGSLTFDTVAAGPDAYPNNSVLGLYSFPHPSLPGGDKFSLTITAGAHSFVGHWGLIGVQDSPTGSPGDHVEYQSIIKSYDGINLPSTFTAGGFGIGLTRTVPPFDVLTSDSLPTTPPNLADFDYSTIFISAQDPTQGIEFLVYGSVTSLTPVPEPTTVAFAIVSLAFALIGQRRRFNWQT